MAHPLCFMAYLEPAEPRNGGFTLWPGSVCNIQHDTQHTISPRGISPVLPTQQEESPPSPGQSL